jgi:hypothetical protein
LTATQLNVARESHETQPINRLEVSVEVPETIITIKNFKSNSSYKSLINAIHSNQCAHPRSIQKCFFDIYTSIINYSTETNSNQLTNEDCKYIDNQIAIFEHLYSMIFTTTRDAGLGVRLENLSTRLSVDGKLDTKLLERIHAPMEACSRNSVIQTLCGHLANSTDLLSTLERIVDTVDIASAKNSKFAVHNIPSTTEKPHNIFTGSIVFDIADFYTLNLKGTELNKGNPRYLGDLCIKLFNACFDDAVQKTLGEFSSKTNQLEVIGWGRAAGDEFMILLASRDTDLSNSFKEIVYHNLQTILASRTLEFTGNNGTAETVTLSTKPPEISGTAFNSPGTGQVQNSHSNLSQVLNQVLFGFPPNQNATPSIADCQDAIYKLRITNGLTTLKSVFYQEGQPTVTWNKLTVLLQNLFDGKNGEDQKIKSGEDLLIVIVNSIQAWNSKKIEILSRSNTQDSVKSLKDHDNLRLVLNSVVKSPALLDQMRAVFDTLYESINLGKVECAKSIELFIGYIQSFVPTSYDPVLQCLVPGRESADIKFNQPSFNPIRLFSQNSEGGLDLESQTFKLARSDNAKHGENAAIPKPPKLIAFISNVLKPINYISANDGDMAVRSSLLHFLKDFYTAVALETGFEASNKLAKINTFFEQFLQTKKPVFDYLICLDNLLKVDYSQYLEIYKFGPDTAVCLNGNAPSECKNYIHTACTKASPTVEMKQVLNGSPLTISMTRGTRLIERVSDEPFVLNDMMKLAEMERDENLGDQFKEMFSDLQNLKMKHPDQYQSLLKIFDGFLLKNNDGKVNNLSLRTTFATNGEIPIPELSSEKITKYIILLLNLTAVNNRSPKNILSILRSFGMNQWAIKLVDGAEQFVLQMRELQKLVKNDPSTDLIGEVSKLPMVSQVIKILFPNQSLTTENVYQFLTSIGTEQKHWSYTFYKLMIKSQVEFTTDKSLEILDRLLPAIFTTEANKDLGAINGNRNMITV